MFTQYPHIIEVKSGETSPQLIDGEYVFPERTTVEYKCRAQSNNKGDSVTTDDGSQSVFEFLVLLPRMDIVYPANTEVNLKVSGKEYKLNIKRHHNTQLNSKIWL